MVITWTYIWSQILTAIEYVLLGASYFGKKRRWIVILDIASMSCGIVALLLLGADLGMAMSVVILLANFYYIWDERHEKIEAKRRKRPKLFFGHQVRDFVVLAVVLAVIAGLAVVTYDGPWSLLSVAATVLYEISIWQNSTKVYKLLGIPVALCWMLYNGAILSVVGAFFEAIMFVAALVGYLREYHAEKKVKQRQMKQQKRQK